MNHNSPTTIKHTINENNSPIAKQKYSFYNQNKQRNKRKSRLLTNDSTSYGGDEMMNSIMLS